MTPGAETRIRTAVAELADALLAAVGESEAPGTPDRLYSVTEAAALCGIGRTRLYAEIGSGRVRVVRAGRRVLIPAASIAELAQGPPGAGK